MEFNASANSAVHTKAWDFITTIYRAGSLAWECHAGYTLLIGILNIVQGGIPAIQLWVFKLLIDVVASGIRESLTHVLILVAAQAGLFLLGNLLSASQETMRTLLGELLTNHINIKILEKANCLEVAFFENEQFYNKLQNAYQEAGYRPLSIVSQLFSLIQTVITFSSMAAMLFGLHWAIVLLILISALPMIIIDNRYGFKNYWMLRERAPELRKRNYYGTLLTSNWFIKEIRLFELENYFLNLNKLLFAEFYSQNKGLILKHNFSNVLASAGSILGWLLATGYVVLRVGTNALSIGDFALYTQTISVTQGQIQAFLRSLNGLYSNSLYLHNLFEFFSLSNRNLSAGKQWREPIEVVEFRDVSFAYPGTSRIVLDNISFKICCGQSLALVGKNGSGKTTLVKLLCCLYKPSSGKILLNGKDISDYSPRSIQKHIAVLFQDFGDYYATAKENIGIGRVDNMANIVEIEEAAKRSGADATINLLSNKYETMLGKMFKDGTELSGGEWQKLALARAFFRNGNILVLDEPTAALDAEAELNVFQDLIDNNKNRITLLISHRFSTVRVADEILVLDNGKCVEFGSHEELIMADGKFAHLFKLQARGYEFASQND
ncbi:MAG: ABC transporter ATP-binding protein [Anaerolinea sp.]|nr:ABC transporter ATP-binding protein [Anaerolinea sp.]